ncbi:MAG: PEP-CTERM sorting domain-containing protein [Proteobacteria bacterium]|nr:PEP-CTERM sorting domain-containing protein [Pseudomonadota bacterium]
MNKKLLAGLAVGVMMLVMAGIAKADVILSSDFEDGTLQGWAPLAPFGGALTLYNNGVDNAFMYATDTAAGGGLLAQAPGLSGDLRYLDSMTWDEFVYDHSYHTVISTYIMIKSLDTWYQSSNVLGAVGGWNSKAVDFNNANEWAISGGGGSASFIDVISNADGVFISMDTSNWSGDNWYESRIDNVVINGTSAPVPVPATMLLFGTGIAGLAGIRIRRKKKA